MIALAKWLKAFHPHHCAMKWEPSEDGLCPVSIFIMSPLLIDYLRRWHHQQVIHVSELFEEGHKANSSALPLEWRVRSTHTMDHIMPKMLSLPESKLAFLHDLADLHMRS